MENTYVVYQNWSENRTLICVSTDEPKMLDEWFADLTPPQREEELDQYWDRTEIRGNGLEIGAKSCIQ